MRSPVSRKTKLAKPATKKTEPKKQRPVTNFMALKPRISEKGYAISEALNTYIFDVPTGANKFDVAAAVAGQYDVAVTGVRLAAVPGKTQRTYQRSARRFYKGQRSNVRKAYVTLKEGEKLPIFAAVEAPKAPEEKK